jgi:hypothetical protein
MIDPDVKKQTYMHSYIWCDLITTVHAWVASDTLLTICRFLISIVVALTFERWYCDGSLDVYAQKPYGCGHRIDMYRSTNWISLLTITQRMRAFPRLTCAPPASLRTSSLSYSLAISTHMWLIRAWRSHHWLLNLKFWSENAGHCLFHTPYRVRNGSRSGLL